MNLTIGKRITLGFATVLTIVVFLGVYGYHSSVVSDSGFTSYREMALDNTLIGRAQANILMMRLGALGFFNTDSKNSADQFWKRNENVEKFIKKAQVEIQNPERSKLVDSVDEKLIAYKTKFKEIIGLFESRDILVNGEHGVNTLGPQMEKKFSEIMTSAFSDNDPAGSYYTAETLKSLLITRLRVLKYLDDNSEDTEGQVRHYLKEFKQKVRVMKKEIQNSRRKALLQEGIKINNLYATSFDKIAKLVTKRNQLIAEMATLGSSIAKDIEDVKLSIKEEQDKIGPKMANNLHRTKIMTIVVSSIATLIGIILAFLIIRSITRVLSKITINLSDASTQVASASKQLSNASQEISSGAVEQASSIEETSSSLEEITGMVAINVDNSEETVKLSNSMMEQFKIGNESIELVQGSMNDILKSNERIEDLVKVIADIGKKTEIMDEIVFQTKLLSFNASVEAESAGEHGRGFAVVAQEVGNLAQMSGKAAQEISDIVKESTDNAQAITAENKNKVEQGNGFVVDTTNVLKEMMSSAKSVLEASHQVLTASKDQSSGIQQISAAMNQLDKATQENAATAEETASTSEQLNAQSSSMLNVVKDLTKLVSGIKKDRTKTSLSPIDTNPSKSLRNIKTANNVESDCSSLTINKASGENWKNL